jgi:phospholipid-transporting ATPase
MITTAHVGVGLRGVEGMQAARASDYSIAQFSYLRKLLLVHGRESYRKNSYIVCYNFYKNIIYVSPQFWFGIISYYSGQTLYDAWIYQLFNIVFASIPIIWFGIFDKEIKYSELYRKPEYYHQGVVNKLFHSARFWKWMLYGILQAYLVYYIIFNCNNTFDPEGNQNDLFTIGSIVYSAVVLIVNIRIFVSTCSHSIFSVTILILSILSYYITVAIMSPFYKFDNFNHIKMINNTNFYLSTLLVIVLTIMIDAGTISILKLFNIIKNPLEKDEKRLNSILTDDTRRNFLSRIELT